MAWTLVGVGTVVDATASPLVLTEPAGVANGDLLIVCIASRTTSTTSPSAAGWNLVQNNNNNNTLTTTSALASGIMAYRIRSGAPSLSFTLAAGISVAKGCIIAYRGSTATPLDVAGAVTMAINTTAINVAGFTTTLANDLIVAMLAGGQEATWLAVRTANAPTGASGATDTTTAPSTTTWTERVDSITTSGADTSLGVFDAVKATAGATGNFTGSASLGAGHVLVAGAFKMDTTAMVGMNVWSGSAWAEKPVKVWSGSAWVQKPVKYWNGSAWV